MEDDPHVSGATGVRQKFPGDELIESGLADLQRGIESVNSLLVAATAPRLMRAGVAVPNHQLDTSGRRLYALLEAEFNTGAHSRYNSLQRQVVSYCAAKTQDARRH